MHLTSLRIRDLRCLQSVDLEPSEGINVLVGDNGTGKTSLLEAIYLLSRGRSFRHAPQSRLIRKDTETLSVYASIMDEAGKSFSIGMTRDSDELRFKLSTDPEARLIHLVRALPVQLIDPGLHALFDEGPSQRRRFLDWGVFHVEHAFYPSWNRYRRALQQRNSILRGHGSDNEVKAWDKDIVTATSHIHATRQRYVDELNKRLPKFLQRFHNTAEIDIQYTPGWPKDMGYAEALQHGLARDRQLGYTMHGPHRADLRIRWHGVKAEQRASRGEQKILICNLMLAQADLLAEQAQKRPVLLVDDLAAELGKQYRDSLIEVINELQLQSFLTCLDEAAIPAVEGQKRFHVEHGRITRVI